MHVPQPEDVQDEATPILIPAAVALIVTGLCVAFSLFAIPWDSIPAPEVCREVPLESFFGRVKAVATVCEPESSARTGVGIAAFCVSLGVIFLSVIFTIRGLTRR